MEKISVDIPERLISTFGKDVDKMIVDILNKRSEKLKLIQEIKKMNLPVNDWQQMEDEIIKGAVE